MMYGSDIFLRIIQLLPIRPITVCSFDIGLNGLSVFLKVNPAIAPKNDIDFHADRNTHHFYNKSFGIFFTIFLLFTSYLGTMLQLNNFQTRILDQLNLTQ